MQTILFVNGKLEHRKKASNKVITKLLGNIKKENHPDFYSLLKDEEKKTISIDKVREMISVINLKPRSSKWKVVTVENADALSVEAQNALLKTIEEPPEYAQVILLAQHKSKLIPTVVSRCIVQSVGFEKLDAVDFESVNENEFDFELSREFLELLKADIGQRIDWVTNNKKLLKDRTAVINILDIWIIVLRKLLLYKFDKSQNLYDGQFEEVVENLFKKDFQPLPALKLAIKTRNYISDNNLNTTISIESFLLNI